MCNVPYKKYFDIVHSLQYNMPLTLETNNFHLQSICMNIHSSLLNVSAVRFSMTRFRCCSLKMAVDHRNMKEGRLYILIYTVYVQS
jgi:hypothetical protein